MVAHTPEGMLRLVVTALGDLVFFGLRRRRRLILSNLHHAFPAKPRAWHRAVGRESCHRLIETALLSLATPFLSKRRYREIVSASPELVACFTEHAIKPEATLICSPHLAYWEAQTAISLILPGPFPEFGTIFRPLDNPAANHLVKTSRERYGMKLLSRKDGFAEALKILRRKGFVGLLFDQNAGQQGALTTLFGRVCSTTELAGLMAEKFNARVYGIFPRRRAFWRVEISVQRIASEGSSHGVTLALNRWLEQLLRSDDNLCASWLWAHDRWRHQDQPSKRLRIEARRNLLAEDLSARGLARLPRGTRIWVRLPNWLGDVIIALPLLRALRQARPDAEITLVGRAAFLPWLETLGVADHLKALPKRGPGYFARFWGWRGAFPDIWLLFTNSFRGDAEAWLAGARHRFGITRPGRPRTLLSHAYPVADEFDEGAHHQLELWENFLRHFGLDSPLDRSPFLPESSATRLIPASIGLIPGSENNPRKRWPVDHWRALIASLPGEHFVIFGTTGDASIARAIAAGHDSARVQNLAGQTDLLQFGAALRECRMLVTNDTGGMHLANALGVPLIGLFGPT
ncbi:MAG: hypothetical protein RIQ93_2005, partial [Verrucomicrobiota bacterium]